MREAALPRAIDGPIFRSEASHDIAPLLTDVLSGTAAHADSEGAAIIHAEQPPYECCGFFCLRGVQSSATGAQSCAMGGLRGGAAWPQLARCALEAGTLLGHKIQYRGTA